MKSVKGFADGGFGGTHEHRESGQSTEAGNASARNAGAISLDGTRSSRRKRGSAASDTISPNWTEPPAPSDTDDGSEDEWKVKLKRMSAGSRTRIVQPRPVGDVRSRI